jgi:mono/diheme cytochrome c family protein
VTNAQKWIAVFLAMFIVLFVLNKITKDDSDNTTDFYNSEQNTGKSELQGIALMEKVGCTACHGQDLKGTKQAPGLYKAREHWSRNDLINYLRNPSAYDGDERFDEYRNMYEGSVMPSYANRDVKELGQIADYLLSLE